jgi:hypothetical protein
MKNKRIQNDRIIWQFIILSCILYGWGYTFYYFFDSGYPLINFMIAPVGRLDDFYNSLYYSDESLIFTKANFTLYPLSVLVYKIFSFQNIHLAALIFFSISIAFFIYACFRLTKNWPIVLLVVTSYPFLFTLARGNNEILLVALGMLCYEKLLQKKVNGALSTIVIQSLVEPFPTYLAQFIPYLKRIKKYIIVLIYSSLIILSGTLLFPPLRMYFHELLIQGVSYSSAIGPGTTLHTSSLSGTFQFIYLVINGVFPYGNAFFLTFTRVLFICSMLGLIWFMFYYRRKIDLTTSSLLIVSSYTLFFVVTFDYRLLHFAIPLCLLLTAKLRKIEISLCILIILLFIPKPFMLFTAINNTIGETLGSVVNPVIIIGIVILTLIRFYRYQPDGKG